MVLSNKKLKQKLRTNLEESLTASMSQAYTNSNNDSTPSDPTSKQTQSIKHLMVSEIGNSRLSKREKRRKIPPLLNSGGVEGASIGRVGEEKMEVVLGRDGSGEKLKKKKRKRDEVVVENGGVIEMKDGDSVKANTSKKAKKKKKKKRGKKAKKEEVVNESGETGNGVQGAVEAEAEADAMQIDESAIASNESGDAATKVYVGGIPYYSSEDDIWSYFESCGTIVEIECMTFSDSGKFRGIAIINFKTEAAAKRALDLDGADMGGLFLKIQPYKATRDPKPKTDFSPEIVEGYNRIYMGNLSWNITEDDVKKFFSDCKISAIRFGKDKETGDFRGYAHVDFSDSLSLTLALKLDQEIVCGRPVKIRCAVPKKVGESDKPEPKRAGESDKPEPKLVGESTKADTKIEEVSKRVYMKAEEESKTVNIKTEESKKESDAAMGSVSSGKIKRRTCYVCGEKGHLSSACPSQKGASVGDSKKVDTKIVEESKKENIKREEEYKKEIVKKVEEEERKKENNEAKVNVSIGKIKRRTCYECGEKGHLSSDCPKKK